MLHLVGSSILLYLIDDVRSNKNQDFIYMYSSVFTFLTDYDAV